MDFDSILSDAVNHASKTEQIWFEDKAMTVPTDTAYLRKQVGVICWYTAQISDQIGAMGNRLNGNKTEWLKLQDERLQLRDLGARLGQLVQAIEPNELDPNNPWCCGV